MDIEVTQYRSPQQHAPRSPKSALKKKSPKKFEKKNKQKPQRKYSDSSTALSDISRADSSNSSRRPVPSKPISRARGRNSLQEKWHHMVHEFEDTYMDGEESHMNEPTGNVGRVGHKMDGVTIPVYAVSTGRKAKDIECESATSAESLRDAHYHKATSMPHRGNRANRRQADSGGGRDRRLGDVSQVSRVGADGYMDVGRVSASEQRLCLQTAPHDMSLHPTEGNHLVGYQEVTDESSRKTSHTKQTKRTVHTRLPQKAVAVSKMGKVVKKKKTLESRAGHMVDHVIDKAIDFLYGSPKPKPKQGTMGTSSDVTHVNNTNVINSLESVNVVDKRSVIDRRRVIQDHDATPRHQIRDVQGHLTERVTSARSAGDDLVYTPEETSLHIAMRQYGGQREHSSMMSPSDMSHHYTSSGEAYSPPTMSPITRRRNLESDQPAQAALGTRDTDRVPYTSDSDYSTTLELKRPQSSSNYVGKAINTKWQFKPTPNPVMVTKKEKPPTLSKGSVTKVLHMMDKEARESEIQDTESTSKFPKEELNLQNEQSHVASTVLTNIDKSENLLIPDIRIGETVSQNNAYSHIHHNGEGSQYLIARMYHTIPANPEVRQPMYSGQHVHVSSVALESKDLPTIRESDETERTMPSHQQYTVSGRIDHSQTFPRQTKSELQDIPSSAYTQTMTQVTQPDVSMNRQQTLNVLLFNNVKGDREGDWSDVCDDREQRGDWAGAGRVDREQRGDWAGAGRVSTSSYSGSTDSLTLYDTEYRDVYIHHKQTQTPRSRTQPAAPAATAAPAQASDSLHAEYVLVADTPSSRRRPHGKDVTRQSVMFEQASQTEHDQQYPMPRANSLPRTTNRCSMDVLDHARTLPQQHSRATQADTPDFSLDNNNSKSIYACGDQRDPRSASQESEMNMRAAKGIQSITPTNNSQVAIKEVDFNSKPMTARNVPIQKCQKHVEDVSVSSDSHGMVQRSDTTTSDPEDDDEERILETTEIEHKEQKIELAIYEEYTFHAQKKEGNHIVSRSVTGEGFDIPISDVDRYEGVVEHKKQARTRITEKKHEGEGVRSSQDRKLSDIERSMKDYMNLDKATDDPNQGFVQQQDPSTVSKTRDTTDEGDASSNNEADQGIVVEAPRSLKMIQRSSFSFPNVPANNLYQREDEELPESLEHFDQVVTTMERELPKQTKSKSDSSIKCFDENAVETAQPRSIDIRRRSFYFPENVTFSRKTGADIVRETKDIERSHSVDDSLLGPVEPLGREASEQTLRTKIVKDKMGNLIKVTELQHSGGRNQNLPSPLYGEILQNREELGDTSYLDVNLLEVDTLPSASEPTADKCLTDGMDDYSGPEVVSETSVVQKPFDLEAQQQTLNIRDDDTKPGEVIFSCDVRSPDPSFACAPGLYTSMSTQL